MKLYIEIDLDNAAIEDGGPDEVARILADLASRLPDPLAWTTDDLRLYDVNGYYAGTALIQG